MSKVVERLAEQAQKLKDGNINNDSVNNFMNYLRQFSDESGANVPHLKLYADWCVHPKLERKGAEGVLAQIESEFRKEVAGPPGTFTADTLIGSLSLEGLRADISSLLGQASVDAAMVANPRAFAPILSVLLEELTHKPLKLSDEKIKSRTAGLKESETTTDYMITSLVMEPNTDKTIPRKFQITANVRPLPPHPRLPAGVNLRTHF